MTNRNQQRAIVVGGSMGGLTAALLLSDLDFDVDVFERSPEPLEGRGAGIVVQPDTVRWFAEHGGTEAVERVSTGSSHLRYLGEDDTVDIDAGTGAILSRLPPLTMPPSDPIDMPGGVLAGDVPVPSSRNAPCPCGSGRKYKHCHGAVA